MMTLASNKQSMKYSLQGERVPIYETDENGNIIYYTDSDGNKIPMETGEYTTGYSHPVPFFANINNKLNEVVWQDYGIDDSTNYAQIIASKGELPLKVGSVIWKKSEVGYKDDEKTIVDETTADYTVKGIADEGMSEDLFFVAKECEIMEKQTVNILGTEYTIEPRELKDEDIDGFTDNTSKLIVIRTDNINEVGDFRFLQKKQLRHEIIHAFMSESGLQCNWQHIEQFGHDETTIDWFAIQSPKIFKSFQELDIL